MCFNKEEMYPNQPNQPTPPQQQPPQPQPEYSIDYLDQISAPQKRIIAPNPLVLLGVIGVGILAIIGFGIMIFSSSGTSGTDRVASLNLRLATLQKIADTQQRNLRDNELRSTNAALSLYLSNTARDMKDPVAALGITDKTIPKNLTTTESKLTSDINAKFEEAKLNVMLDRSYAREMTYQIGVLRSMMTSAYKNTSNQKLKATLETSDPSLAQVAKNFESFSGSR